MSSFPHEPFPNRSWKHRDSAGPCGEPGAASPSPTFWSVGSLGAGILPPPSKNNLTQRARCMAQPSTQCPLLSGAAVFCTDPSPVFLSLNCEINSRFAFTKCWSQKATELDKIAVFFLARFQVPAPIQTQS